MEALSWLIIKRVFGIINDFNLQLSKICQSQKSLFKIPMCYKTYLLSLYPWKVAVWRKVLPPAWVCHSAYRFYRPDSIAITLRVELTKKRWETPVLTVQKISFLNVLYHSPIFSCPLYRTLQFSKNPQSRKPFSQDTYGQWNLSIAPGYDLSLII